MLLQTWSVGTCRVKVNSFDWLILFINFLLTVTITLSISKSLKIDFLKLFLNNKF